MKEILSGSSDNVVVSNIGRWLDQLRHDALIPEKTLESFEARLRAKLEIQSRKLGLAGLYSHLVTEWMTPSTSTAADGSSDGSQAASDDSFAVVERQKERLQQPCDMLESLVFHPLEIDKVEIDSYLRHLFEGDTGTKALETLQQAVQRQADALLRTEAPFDESTLTLCIKGLLVEDLLNDEKQSVSHEFLKNSIVLAEIADVLNMHYADIENWKWQAGEQGIPVMPRQQQNRKYRICTGEGVLQAIFIHCIGVTWCVSLKNILKGFIGSQPMGRWTQGPQPTRDEAERYHYYTGRALVNPGLRLASSYPCLARAATSNLHSVERVRKADYNDTFSCLSCRRPSPCITPVEVTTMTTSRRMATGTSEPGGPALSSSFFAS